MQTAIGQHTAPLENSVAFDAGGGVAQLVGVGNPSSPLAITSQIAATSPRFFFFINGINLAKNAFFDWHLNAVRWIEGDKCPENWRAEPFSYQVSAVDRWLHQKQIIAAAGKVLAGHIACRPNDPVTVVGHSNGCAVACGMLRENPLLKIDELHLIASAETSDCDKNGINAAIHQGRVRRLCFYCSHADSALAWAKRTRWLGWLNPAWEYGWMGLDGPNFSKTWTVEFPDGTRTMAVVKWFDGYDHSTYFEPSHFENTMARVINHGEDATCPFTSNVKQSSRCPHCGRLYTLQPGTRTPTHDYPSGSRFQLAMHLKIGTDEMRHRMTAEELTQWVVCPGAGQPLQCTDSTLPLGKNQ